MLKRGGKPIVFHDAQDHTVTLTGEQSTAYDAAIRVIEQDLREIRGVREGLARLENVRWESPAPRAFDTIRTPEGEWSAHAQLFRLFRGEILLCRRAGGDEWAVIQRFPKNSIYAQTHGDTDILLKGNNVRELMNEYMAQVQHTLHFMARNAEAKAQKIVWEQFPDNNPSLVVSAISERCNKVADTNQSLRRFQSQSQAYPIGHSRGIGV